MADKKITELDTITGFPKTTDYIPLATDILSTPVTKKMQVYQLAIGWTQFEATVTYASATSFTMGGDLTSLFKLGGKLSLFNSTYKYAYVLSSTYSSPNTTVNLIPNTDYSLADTTITNLLISYSNPPDFPDWFDYTSTVSGSSGSAGTYAESVYSSMFSISGRNLTLIVSKKINNVGSWAGQVQVLLPVPIATENLGLMSGGIMATAALAVKANPILLTSGTNMKFMKNWNSVYGLWSDVAVNDFILLRGSYPI